MPPAVLPNVKPFNVPQALSQAIEVVESDVPPATPDGRANIAAAGGGAANILKLTAEIGQPRGSALFEANLDIVRVVAA